MKTYVVMLSPDSNLTPSMLAEKISKISDINYKETCYGLLIEGEDEVVEKAIKELKEMDPNRIFVKARGFRIGDERICRAKRGGGPRPGFFMLGLERSVLKNVAKALESAEEAPRRKRDKLNYEILKKIVEEA
ncbi:MAG: methanogenesis marker 6 protein [Candidatus Methanomethyliaceae archaeon]|nr:methanogenesis marker 6 protein [Candidatus Methanomethyliaceae archaeon]MDW7970855.1 methanogenesis marker 6 protein [Nitrososphaerota archaeon]